MLDGWTFVHPRSSFSTKYLLFLFIKKTLSGISQIFTSSLSLNVKLVQILSVHHLVLAASVGFLNGQIKRQTIGHMGDTEYQRTLAAGLSQ